jgi:hypothetical protein
MCRAGCLPVMSRVVWELGLSPRHGRCPLCTTGEAESIEHMMLRCPAHHTHRSKMMTHVGAVYSTHAGVELETACEETQVCILLGARAGGKAAEDIIDVQVKRFLVKVWKARRVVSRAVNKKFDRQDVVWKKEWGRSGPGPTDKAGAEDADGGGSRARTVPQRNSPAQPARMGPQSTGTKARAPCKERSKASADRALTSAGGFRRRLFD